VRFLACFVLVACSEPHPDPPPALAPVPVVAAADADPRPVIRPHRSLALMLVPIVTAPFADGSFDKNAQLVAGEVFAHLHEVVGLDHDVRATAGDVMRSFDPWHDCSYDDGMAECVAERARRAAAEYALFGRVAPATDGFAVELQLVDVEHRTVRTFAATTPQVRTSIRSLAIGAYDYFIARM